MTSKKALLFVVIMVVCCAVSPRGRAAGRVNLTVTISAGTPVHVWTQSTPYFVNELLIQPQPGASVGLIYVMAGIGNSRTPASTASSDLTATLCAATATVPGCTYSDGTLATPNSAAHTCRPNRASSSAAARTIPAFPGPPR